MYPLLETIKIDNGSAFHISLHQERMNRACFSLFGTKYSIDLSDCLAELTLPPKGVFKCRLLYGNGIYKIAVEPYTPQKIKSLKLIVDNTIDYSYKFSDRKALSHLLIQKGSADEIVIVKNALITDASFANLVFWDGVNWVTPSNPLLEGVQREYLLKNGLIKQSLIKPSDLKKYSKVALINAMLNFEDKIELPIESVL